MVIPEWKVKSKKVNIETPCHAGRFVIIALAATTINFRMGKTGIYLSALRQLEAVIIKSDHETMAFAPDGSALTLNRLIEENDGLKTILDNTQIT
jgi:hypothetical protein